MLRIIVLVLFMATFNFLNALEQIEVDGDIKYDMDMLVNANMDNQEDIYTKYYDNKTVIKYQVPIEKEKRNGIQKGYYENGALKYEIPFVNGKAHGYLKVYYINGNIKMSALYSNNIKDGIWKGYKENGELKFSYRFKNNYPVEILYE